MHQKPTSLLLFVAAAFLAVVGGRALGRLLGEGDAAGACCDAAPRTALAEERAQGFLEQYDAAVTDVAARVRPSVVQVLVRRVLPVDVKEGGAQESLRDQVATSGVVWSADGYILSLGRAFESADAIDVVLSGAPAAGRDASEARGSSEAPAASVTRRAELIGTDDETGLALLRIDPKGAAPGGEAPGAAAPTTALAPLTAIALGSAQALKVGSLVVSVGNPFGLQGSVSVGHVSGLHRAVKRGQRGLSDVIQITTPVNPGDPGGLLADARGRAVGIVASTYERASLDPDALGKVYRDILKLGEGLFQRPPTEELRRLMRSDEARFAGGEGPTGAQGIGFAIPIDEARAVVDRLKAGPLSERGYLGVQVIGLEAPQTGVAVVGVKEGSPAEKAGLRQHDVVTRFGGKAVPTTRDFKRLVLEAPVGVVVEIEVRRGEAVETVKAILEKRGKPRQP